jgi:glucokinase
MNRTGWLAGDEPPQAPATGELFAGVDLGGAKVAAVVGRGSGELLASSSAPTLSHEGPEAVLARIAAQVAGLAGDEPLAAAGVGVPGLVDLARGESLFLPNLPTQWRKVAIAGFLSSRWRCPVYLLNDCRAAALGELRYGRGRQVQTMALFVLGTGVGGGLVIDGKLRLGPLGAAAELGHQTILPDGPLCGCGNRGCLETLASGPAITAEGVRLVRSGLAPLLYGIVEGDAGRVSPKTMAAAASAGEESVRVAIERAAAYLAVGVANVVTALHPELVVIGGGVAAMGDLLFDPLRAAVGRRVRMFPADSVAIEPSALGDKAGLYGALALAISRGAV